MFEASEQGWRVSRGFLSWDALGGRASGINYKVFCLGFRAFGFRASGVKP